MTYLDKPIAEIIDDAIRELKRLQLCPENINPSPYQTSTGIAQKSAVLFFCIDIPGEQSRHYVVKFDQDSRANIEKSAHILFRDFRKKAIYNMGFQDPFFERWISEHEQSSPNFCVYECAANFSDNRTFQTLRDYLLDHIKNDDFCIPALELTLENLLALNCSSSTSHILKDSYRGRALKLGDLSAACSTEDYRYVKTAISNLTLALGTHTSISILQSLYTALGETSFREIEARLCGRTIIGPVHGDMNSTNAVVVTGTCNVPKQSLMIDLSHFDIEQPVLRDYAKLEVDLWMQVLPQLLPADIVTVGKSLDLGDLYRVLNNIYVLQPNQISVALEGFSKTINFIRKFILTNLPSVVSGADDNFTSGSAMEFDIVRQYHSSVYFAAIKALYHLGKGGVELREDENLLRVAIAIFVASSSHEAISGRLPTNNVLLGSYKGPRIFVSPQSNTVDGFSSLASKVRAIRLLGSEKCNYDLVTTHECDYYERLLKFYTEQRVDLSVEDFTLIIARHKNSLAAFSKAAVQILFNTKLRESCMSLRDSRRAAETISIMANFSQSNPIKNIVDPARIEFRSESDSSRQLSALVAISRQKLVDLFWLTGEKIATADVYRIAADKDIHRLIVPYLLLELFRANIPEDAITDEHFSLLNWYFKPY